MKSVVLFDFHNTLAICDAWLDLEIRTLPEQVLTLLADEGEIEYYTPAMLERAGVLFRDLRTRVKQSGVEVSAVDGVGEVLRELGIGAHDGAVERAVRSRELALLPQVEMVQGADHALDRLARAGHMLGVVSSAGYPPFVELALEKLGLRSFFSEVVTSTGEGIYKSDGRLFVRALEKLGVEPSRAIHVGDHPVFDVRAATAAGLRAIWFAAHAHRTAQLRGAPWSEAELDTSQAVAVVHSMDELVTVIEGLG